MTFRVGGAESWRNPSGIGWHGQQWYTRTTMCEDNVWSYAWASDPTLGEVAEAACLRQTRADGKSKTRNPQLDKATPCALIELVKAFASPSYQVVTHVSKPSYVTMQWTPDSAPIRLNKKTGGYVPMSTMLSKMASACQRLGIGPITKPGFTVWNAAVRKVFGMSRLLTRGSDLMPSMHDTQTERLVRNAAFIGVTLTNHSEHGSSLPASAQATMARVMGTGVPPTNPPSLPASAQATMARVMGTAPHSETDASTLDGIQSIQPPVGQSTTGGAFPITHSLFGRCLLKVFHADVGDGDPQCDAQLRREIAITKRAGELGVGPTVFAGGVLSRGDRDALTARLRSALRPSARHADVLERVLGASCLAVLLMDHLGYGEEPPWTFAYAVMGRLPKTKLDKAKVGLAAVATLLKLHRGGILHNDLNFGNVLVRRSDQRVFLIDYGKSSWDERASVVLEAQTNQGCDRRSLARYAIRTLLTPSSVEALHARYPEMVPQLRRERELYELLPRTHPQCVQRVLKRGEERSTEALRHTA